MQALQYDLPISEIKLDLQRQLNHKWVVGPDTSQESVANYFCTINLLHVMYVLEAVVKKSILKWNCPLDHLHIPVDPSVLSSSHLSPRTLHWPGSPV